MSNLKIDKALPLVLGGTTRCTILIMPYHVLMIKRFDGYVAYTFCEWHAPHDDLVHTTTVRVMCYCTVWYMVRQYETQADNGTDTYCMFSRILCKQRAAAYIVPSMNPCKWIWFLFLCSSSTPLRLCLCSGVYCIVPHMNFLYLSRRR